MADLQCWNVSGLERPEDGPAYIYVLVPSAWSAAQVREGLALLEDTEAGADFVRLHAILAPVDHRMIDGQLYVGVDALLLHGEPPRLPGVRRIIAATEASGLYGDNDETAKVDGNPFD